MPELQKNQVFEQSIFATIAYYDYFNYPLTASEIYQYLINLETKDQRPKTKNTNQNQKTKPPFYEIIKILDEGQNLKKLISHKNGFYFLAGREEIIASRIQRKKLADQKFKKSKWILKLISSMPFVRLAAISGSMGLGNPHNKSDIDLLIIAKHGRIWTTRAFLTFFSLLSGKYRHAGIIEDRLCLNHYITDKTLRIDFGNLYKAQEYLNLLPVAGKMKIYGEFLSANKKWLENYVYPDSRHEFHPGLLFAPLGNISMRTKRAAEYLLFGFAGDRLEKWLGSLQVYFIKRNPLNNASAIAGNAAESAGYSRIKYNNDNLVFHPVLVEPEIIGRYEEKLRQLKAYSP